MNREEAIAILDISKTCHGVSGRKYDEAIDMAISALSADGDIISRADAVKAILEKREETKGAWYGGMSEAVDVINALPSAEAVQGEWICKYDGYRAFYWYECDKCGAKPPKDQWKNEWHSPYCPSCGARMKGGGSE